MTDCWIATTAARSRDDERFGTELYYQVKAVSSGTGELLPVLAAHRDAARD
jgi:hypothetical protein